MRWQRWAVVTAIPLLIAGVFALIVRNARVVDPVEPAMGPSPGKASTARPESRMSILPRELDVAGIANPEFVKAADAKLKSSDAVIGLMVDGGPRAYLTSALAGVPLKHVVSDHTQAGLVTVTHCDLIDCTRVFVEPTAEAHSNIRVGGLQRDQSLSLLISGKPYSLRDQSIPLEELPFTETSWGQWLAAYPATIVYVGGRKAETP